MPYTSATETVIRPALTANIWQVVQLILDATALQISVVYTPGHKDGEATIWGETTTLTVDATPYLTLKPSNIKTYYENLRGMAYKILQDAGVAPADGVIE